MLGEASFDVPPSQGEHVCLATFDHGLSLASIPSRHEPELGFDLVHYPVLARLTVDHATGATTRTGEPDHLDAPSVTGGYEAVVASGLSLSHDAEGFSRMVEAAQGYITEGHSYQVNLSLRATVELSGDPIGLFHHLRSTNPSPYQALVVTPELTLVSASPELLLDVQGDRLATRPIAGTRPRGATPDEDARLEAELVRDGKERAEHAMLVDLARNDLGRVSRFGTVEVSEYGVVERYSHVMHLVSEVQGRLAESASPWDAFEAVFPCGTISGAPKRRSLEIIDELEPTSRGAYTGSLGLITPERTTWNILIRSLVLQEGRAHIQAGAGIVAESVPAREYKESLDKARALLEALGVPEVPG